MIVHDGMTVLDFDRRELELLDVALGELEADYARRHRAQHGRPADWRERDIIAGQLDAVRTLRCRIGAQLG